MTKIKYRVVIDCPVCGGPTAIKRSQRVSNLSRQYSLVQCVNPLCGWSGCGVFEVTHTLSQPSAKYQSKRLPPMANGDVLNELD